MTTQSLVPGPIEATATRHFETGNGLKCFESYMGCMYLISRWRDKYYSWLVVEKVHGPDTYSATHVACTSWHEIHVSLSYYYIWEEARSVINSTICTVRVYSNSTWFFHWRCTWRGRLKYTWHEAVCCKTQIFVERMDANIGLEVVVRTINFISEVQELLRRWGVPHW